MTRTSYVFAIILAIVFMTFGPTLLIAQPGTTTQPQLEPRLAALEQRVAALEARPAPLPSKRQRDETRAQMKSFCAQRGLAFDSLEVGPRGEAVLVRCR